MTLFLVCLLAWALDQWLGEPQRAHPLVGFGKLVSWLEARTNHWQTAGAQIQRLRGLISLLLLISPFIVLALLASYWQEGKLLLEVLVLYLAIAGCSLVEHGHSVMAALQKKDLDEARKKVSWMVSRDTEQMDEAAVKRATIESLLENGNDAIFAAIFWFVVAGLPGVVLYRLVNTLDAMWGYRSERYLYFGWAAARLDDLLNWLPARLTALTYALLGHSRTALRCWSKQGGQCESPNAGPVMAAGAGALQLELGGAATYHGELHERPQLGEGNAPQTVDIQRTCNLLQHGQLLWLVIIFLLGVVSA